MPVTGGTVASARPALYMPVQIAGPCGIGRPPDTGRRTVLLTGGSGVVGRALLRRLGDCDVVCLVHRSPVSGPNVTTVPGDIAKPMFGLAGQVYAELAARVDAIIHCAAITGFNRTDGSLEATNIEGTEHVTAFAAAAAAKPVLYHVSTAFVHTTADGDRGRTAIGYASSKSAAEQVVRSSGVPHVILRPSVVIGDSDTGEIAAFQGLHQVVAGLFAGIVPMIPFDPGWPIDFVPVDVVADSIACLVENRVSEGEFWISAGEAALSLDEGVAVVVEFARGLGVTHRHAAVRTAGHVRPADRPGLPRRAARQDPPEHPADAGVLHDLPAVRPDQAEQPGPARRARREAAARPARIAAEQPAVLGGEEWLRPGRYRTGGLT